MVTEAEVRKALRKVKDPEMKLDLVVLGLIYKIEINGTHVDVTMSLTSPGCPVAGELLNQAREAVESV
ncbi:MAG TPA: metal-sulfur cluster assembly factor, partial [Longimicrobium sp.]|nr:metal-sulfur cluster assembly factor [Longimicrobium sp.]